MSVEGIRKLFEKDNLGHLVMYNEVTSDTVENAAKMIGCKEEQIAKTMAFYVDEQPIVIVSIGEAKIDNAKYKKEFVKKAKIVPFDMAESVTGHIPGGISPFALKEDVKAYLDVSLKRFDIVYSGGGDEYNIVKCTIPLLKKYSNYEKWIDVCKNWTE